LPEGDFQTREASQGWTLAAFKADQQSEPTLELTPTLGATAQVRPCGTGDTFCAEPDNNQLRGPQPASHVCPAPFLVRDNPAYSAPFEL
jgi:hypothetical protein